MGDLASELKKLNLSELSKTIEKGTVIVIEDDDAEKFIKDKNNNAPHFVTKKFRDSVTKKKGSSAKEHYWIFLKTYQKRGNSGKVKIVNRSSLQKGDFNRRPNDLFQSPHISIDPDHGYCRINKEGLWKAELPKNQKLDKNFLRELNPSSDSYICIDPQANQIIRHFNELEEVYD